MKKNFSFFYQLPEHDFLFPEETIYFQFLKAKWAEFQNLRTIKTEEELKGLYELHHILPRHAGGTEGLENLIPLTPEDHALAHYYRYCVTKDVKDLWVWNLRKNVDHSSFQTPASRLALARRLFQQHCQQEKKYFWNSIWQTEQAMKGASKGGKANSQKQNQERKRTGKLLGKRYGKENGQLQGRNNQKQETKKVLERSYVWTHDSFGVFETTPHSTLIDLAEQCLAFENFRQARVLQHKTGRFIAYETEDRSFNLLSEMKWKIGYSMLNEMKDRGNSEKREVARQLGRLLRKERNSYYGWKIFPKM